MTIRLSQEIYTFHESYVVKLSNIREHMMLCLTDTNVYIHAISNLKIVFNRKASYMGKIKISVYTPL